MHDLLTRLADEDREEFVFQLTNLKGVFTPETTRVQRALDAAIAALSTPDDGRPVDGWRPIETAPKDGKAILAWFPRSKCVFSAVWFGDKWMSFGGEGDFFGEMPTHWTTPPEFEPAGAPSPLKKIAAALEAKADSETFENWKLRQALAEYPERNKHQLQAAKVCEGVRKLAEAITPPTARPEVEECETCGGSGEIQHEWITARCCGRATPSGDCCGNPEPEQNYATEQCPDCPGRSAGDVYAEQMTPAELAKRIAKGEKWQLLNPPIVQAKAEGDAYEEKLVSFGAALLRQGIELEKCAEYLQPTETAPKPAGCEVRIDKQGVAFGNSWFSHEHITGRTAASLNDGSCGLTAREYMKWVGAAINAAQPKAVAVDAKKLLSDIYGSLVDRGGLVISSADVEFALSQQAALAPGGEGRKE